jgi:hypothetical protein
LYLGNIDSGLQFIAGAVRGYQFMTITMYNSNLFRVETSAMNIIIFLQTHMLLGWKVAEFISALKTNFQHPGVIVK